MLIDDDEVYSKAFAFRLDRAGLRVHLLARDTPELLDIINSKKIDLVLLDLVLPESDGISLLRRIREQYKQNDLPIIIVTGMDANSDISDSFENGANDYITKPLRIDLAIARIKAHLSQRDLAKEHVRQRELFALNAMIVTYCHEINTPLSVALSEVEKLSNSDSKECFDRLNKALARIRDVTEKIRQSGEKSEIIFQNYAAGNSKMVKIR
ncbi:MAG: response regulator [Candidatus Pacebacteria bacterium]|nr:response regulator [Candidatus Paceibacterota bacterium]